MNDHKAKESAKSKYVPPHLRKPRLTTPNSNLNPHETTVLDTKDENCLPRSVLKNVTGRQYTSKSMLSVKERESSIDCETLGHKNNEKYDTYSGLIDGFSSIKIGVQREHLSADQSKNLENGSQTSNILDRNTADEKKSYLECDQRPLREKGNKVESNSESTRMSNELLDKTPVTKSAVSYIPASVRADGSVRKERRVREGYAPRESIPRYVIPMLRSSSQSPELSNREIKKKGNDTNTGIGRGIYRNVDSKTPEFSKEDFPPL